MSYAVIQTGGKQYKVKSGEILKIEKLPDSKPETKIEFKEILAYGDNKLIEVGAPIVQGAKFDPNGDYVREYIPELSQIPTKFIHKPWEAPEDILLQVGIILDKDYPLPIVDLKLSRERALSAFKSLSENN